TRTLTFTPTDPLVWSATYHVAVTVSGADVSNGSWSFDTADEPTVLTATSIFGDAESEEHTSELQSRENLVCRLLLEKKKIGTLSFKFFNLECCVNNHNGMRACVLIRISWDDTVVVVEYDDRLQYNVSHDYIGSHQFH